MTVREHTDQEMMEYLLERAEGGAELIAGLQRAPVAYDPNSETDAYPFVDLDTGDRYPPRQVFISLNRPKGNR
jgi:hypothetical protein